MWLPLYDGEDDKPEDPKPEEGKVFTQDDVNRILAREKRKHESSTQTALDELNALKAKADLTKEEREDLEGRIEGLQSSLRTKEQQAAHEKQKLEKEYKTRVEQLEQERGTWQNRYTGATITRSITDAAATHKAFSPEQIVALLQPQTRLTEELDDEGKPTGEFVAKVTFHDTDKDSKPVKLDLTVPEAVKRMTELDRFSNLFEFEGSGGAGRSTAGKPASKDLTEIYKDPAKYREARKKGLIT